MGVDFWATVVACASILSAVAVVIRGLSQVVTCRLDEPWDIDTQERQRDLHVSDGINYCPLVTRESRLTRSRVSLSLLPRDDHGDSLIKQEVGTVGNGAGTDEEPQRLRS